MLIGITGASGTLGKELVNLLKKKHELSFFNGDIRNYKHLNEWLANTNINAIIHLASIVSIKDVNKNPKFAKDVNYIGTKNLIKVIRNKKIKKKIWFFYSSTSHVYSYSNKKLKETDKIRPLNYYANTKLMSEKILIKNKKMFNLCIGRIFSFSSNNQKKNYFIPSVIKKMKSNNKTLIFKNVNHYRDFLSIEDISNAINILLDKKAKGIFNICSSKKIYLVDIINALNTKNKKIKFKFNTNQSILVGNNLKLKNLGWKIKYNNYLMYIKKMFQ